MKETYKKFLPDKLLEKIKAKNKDSETITLEDIEVITDILNKNRIHQKYSVELPIAYVNTFNKVIAERREKKLILPEELYERCIKEIRLNWEHAFDDCYMFSLSIELKNKPIEPYGAPSHEYYIPLPPESSSGKGTLTLKIIQPSLSFLMSDLLLKMSDPKSLPDL